MNQSEGRKMFFQREDLWKEKVFRKKDEQLDFLLPNNMKQLEWCPSENTEIYWNGILWAMTAKQLEWCPTELEFAEPLVSWQK